MKIIMHLCLITLLAASIWGIADVVSSLSHHFHLRQPWLIAFSSAFIVFGLLMLGIFWGAFYE